MGYATLRCVRIIGAYCIGDDGCHLRWNYKDLDLGTEHCASVLTLGWIYVFKNMARMSNSKPLWDGGTVCMMSE